MFAELCYTSIFMRFHLEPLKVGAYFTGREKAEILNCSGSPGDKALRIILGGKIPPAVVGVIGEVNVFAGFHLTSCFFSNISIDFLCFVVRKVLI